jgi:hypothetical protein
MRLWLEEEAGRFLEAIETERDQWRESAGTPEVRQALRALT